MRKPVRFAIATAEDVASPLARQFPGVRSARDTTGDLVGVALAAIPVERGAPPHGRLDMLMGAPSGLGGLVLPLARLAAHGRDWILCRAPPQPSLGVLDSFKGDAAQLVGRIARAAAGGLARLDRAGMTHRAVNPFNLFPSADGPELGPFWAAPPACTQRAVFEPPSIASCMPAGRGAGTIADDVYALGVTLLALFLGQVPLADLPDEEIVERKLWLGSAGAILKGLTLPSAFAELIGAMIADEPSHRPRPERLEGSIGVLGPNASSRRRINAALPLAIGTREIWTTTQLVWSIALHPDIVLRALLNGQVDSWLRRGLNEIVLAERIENFVRPNGRPVKPPGTPEAEAEFLAFAATLLDPPSPGVWGGLRFQADGLPGLLASLPAADEATRTAIVAMLEAGIVGPQSLREKFVGRDRPRPWTRFAISRLAYELNPAGSCASPAVAGLRAASVEDLLYAIESLGAEVAGPVLDSEMTAFAAARQRTPIVTGEIPDERAQLKALAHFATELRARCLPAVARRLAGSALREVEGWPGRSAREKRRARLEGILQAGDLMSLYELGSDDAPLIRDKGRQARAHGEIERLRKRAETIRAAHPGRLAQARRFGHEAVSLVAVAATVLVLLAGALG